MDKRWWEFYALRYALGTVMGVFILLYLFIHTDIATRFGGFGVWHIVIYLVRLWWYFMH